MKPLASKITTFEPRKIINYKCLNCKTSLSLLNEKAKFCFNCGEPIEWDGILLKLSENVGILKMKSVGQSLAQSKFEDLFIKELNKRQIGISMETCSHCKKEFTKEEIELEEYEVVDSETFCLECSSDCIKTCSCCGKDINIDDKKYQIIDGEYYCSKCVSEEFGICDLCREYIPREELAYTNNILCCDKCSKKI